ncbi:hypothetical protein QQX98_000852 [Neonectria punicea]|uniref:Kievitone hydratase n=1 Tax=Neonectria punicea TaxID=979145 RepID=A0ABR1HS63_9HYPO
MRILNFFASVGVCGAYVFKPESHADFKNSFVPALVNYTDSQYDVASGAASYWISSYIIGDDKRQYLAISHILTTKNPSQVCRSSILDLRTLEYWVDLTYCSNKNDSAFDRPGPLSGDFGTYAFGSTSDDSVSSMYAYPETNRSFSLDLTWKATSRAMQNGGGGIIAFGPGPSNATEWGIPAGKTSGSITLNGSTIEVDPKHSFTWYDRQISYGVPRNWTWFQVNFPGSSIKASIWKYDLGPPSNQAYQFATVRNGNSVEVLAYTLTPDGTRTWTSPNSGRTYPLLWKLEFENGDHLTIKSVRDDQEMYGSLALVDSAYEGFITVRGKFEGQREGFGVVEMVTAY